MNYQEALTKAMTDIAQDNRSIFLGQSIRYQGQAMFSSLGNVPMDKRIELPVFEDMQMGMSIGLSLMGYIPISLFPRMDFLILAMNQLVNHLDKIDEMSHGEFKPKVIIRTMVGTKEPLDGGVQHVQDYADVLDTMLTSVRVCKLKLPSDIIHSYADAMQDSHSYVMVEYGSLY